jgi:hypothetical protein
MKGIARISSGALTGTAFLVSSKKALTAAHCIEGGVESVVEIHFRNPLGGSFGGIQAKVLAKDDKYDAAILELQGALPIGLEPFELCTCGTLSGQDWTGFGFPHSYTGLTNGLKLTGQLSDGDAQLAFTNNVPAIQMTCIEAPGCTRLRLRDRVVALDLEQPHILAGISGGPVCASDQAGRVVGIIRWAGTPNAQTVFASRIQDIFLLFKEFLQGVTIRPWQSDCEFFIQTQADTPDQVVSNLDQLSVSALWEGHSAKTLDCDFSVREAGPLAPVILRLFAHAPGSVVLRSTNNASWITKVQSLGHEWFPHGEFDAAEVASRCHHRVAVPAHVAIARPMDDFCRMLQLVCDKWVLQRLDDKWQQLLANPHAQTIGYQPSEDNLKLMNQTWESWYRQLNGDPQLCHHFLSLMLKADGMHNCQVDTGIGLGPKTLTQCLWPALVFSLLLSPHFDGGFGPHRPIPGNLGATLAGGQRRSGHVCGIQRHNRKLLSLGLGGHRWKTQVVMLPGSQLSAAMMDSLSAPIDQETGAIATGLNAPPPDSAIFHAENGLLQAAQSSLADVRAYVARREAEHAERQRKYVMNSGAR